MQICHTSLINRITEKIRIALSPDDLQVINESHLHVGHQPQFNGLGETHIRIKIVSPTFTGISKTFRHRKIYDLLHKEIKEELHALSIEAFSPDEKHTLKNH
ncbi:BolA family protein [Candidatus Liberibacter asiaticus]|uniref:BolA family protein n=2 Tax=Liberibacter asiaticus TaxID=34021 RepID=C6XFA6_LIBAP|nr:BolA family protein [Candidatus Liberibacter asiaticus]ACT57059.1 BolA family protein [Candidatus Liberibacter asiaticus str. psy62]AGH16976.1 BolA family protein [Candidatus Liberibacter asiaticus str. gxpsy]ALK07312.1 BolA/IbaG family iron-sulfur metabolism protein [Candidatus Liberibacter asiaticus]ASK52803.1 BolA family transcriptional regulator [Candidatus Liberibacter asiaticus]AWL14120.1 BolA family transcriptional regulator [Candidatus Liberibacter asiaticus]